MPRKGDFTAVAILRGEDDLTVPWAKALARAERRNKKAFTRMERAGLRSLRVLSKGAAFLGKAGGFAAKGFTRGRRALGMLTKVAGGTAGTAALLVDQFGKFELEVARLGNVIAKGVDPVAEYETTLRQLSVQFGTDPIETARAAYMAFSGGVKTTKKGLQEFLPVALKAAQAGFAEPAVVVDALTTALNVFGKDGLTAVDIANKLFITEALGKTDFAQLAGSMGQVASFAKTMGLSLDEVLAPLIAITKQGVTTDAAVTQLTAILGGIISPAKKFRKAFKKFEIPFGREGITAAGGMAAVITKIQAAVAKDPDAIVKLFGRKEAQKGLFTVTEEGFIDVEKGLKRLQNSSTELDDNWANVERRTGFRIKQMKTGFKLLVTELGGGIAEGLGLDKIANVPGAVMKAGKTMRAASKGFAEGFVEALLPGQKFAEIDWVSIARDAGGAFGSFITHIKEFTAVAIEALTAIKDIITGDDPAKRALKKQGLKEQDLSVEGQIATQRKAGGGFNKRVSKINKLRASLRSGGVDEPNEDPRLIKLMQAHDAEVAKGSALRLIKSIRDQLGGGSKAFAAFASSPGGKALGADKFVGSSADRALRRLQRDQGVLATGNEGLKPGEGRDDGFNKALGGKGATEVGGEVVVTVQLEGAPSGTTSKVEATTKNPKVPVRAKVGKRKTASE